MFPKLFRFYGSLDAQADTVMILGDFNFGYTTNNIAFKIFEPFAESTCLIYIYVYSPRRQIQRKEIEQIDRGQNLQSNKETFC